MAGTPKQSGTSAGGMTVRGYNLQNSLGKVNIAGLFNSTSDPSGVLNRQAQDEAIANQIINSLEAENAEAAEANTGGPKTDFPGTNRDLTSDSIGGYAVDLGSVYSLFPNAATGAVIAAMQNDYLNSLLEEGQYKGLSDAERLDLFTELQTTNAPRFISSEEGIRPATEQETADFYDDIVDYLLGLGSVPKTTEDTVIEGTLGESQGEEIDRFFGIFNNAETDASIVEKIQEQVRRIGSAVGKAQDTVFDLLGIPKPDYSVIQPNAPGGTVIWGQPSGGVFGRIGTTPGGTVTGVQTGIPALDILLGKVADVASGRATTGDVLNTETIKDIIVETAGDELGIPGDPNQILADIKEIGSKVFYDENTGKLGIDLGDGSATPTGETPTLGSDRVTTTTGGGITSTLPTGETPTLGSDRVTTTTGGGITSTLPTGETPTLGSDRVTTTGGGITSTLPTGETPTLGSDRVTTTTGGGITSTLPTGETPTLGSDRVTTGGVTLDKAPTLTTDKVTTGGVTLDKAPTLTTDKVTTGGVTLDKAPTLTTDKVTTGGVTLDKAPTLTTDKVTTGGVTLDKAPTLTTDRATTGGVTLDKAPTLTTDRATTGDVILDRAPVLVTDRTNTIEDPTLTERTPTLTTDRADEVPGGDGGGGGLGQQSGVRTVSGGPGDVVDIDYLFDIAGQSIFAPVLEDEDEDEDEEDKYRPYVYAKSGGMINTYDAVDKLIRFLNRT
jgi:hypothetical protein